MKLITILVPCYNEEQSLPSLYKLLNSVVEPMSGYEFEYLFVNNGSYDHTLKHAPLYKNAVAILINCIKCK